MAPIHRISWGILSFESRVQTTIMSTSRLYLTAVSMESACFSRPQGSTHNGVSLSLVGQAYITLLKTFI